MRSSAPHLGALTAVFVACSGAPSADAPAATTSAVVVGSVAPSGALPPPGSDRVPLGPTRRVLLEASLAPIRGSNEILAFVDHAGEPALLARIVGVEGPVGGPIVIPNAHFVDAFQKSDGRVSLATVEDDKLCLRAIEGGLSTTPTCFETSAYGLAAVGDDLFVLDLRPPTPEDEDEEIDPKTGKPKETVEAKAKLKPKAKPKAKPQKKPTKRKRKPTKKPRLSQKEAVRRMLASAKEVELWATPLSREEGLGEATFTGLEFREAMAGVKFIGAHGRKDRIDVAFYEHADRKGKESRAKLGVAVLDATATFDPASKKAFGESRLEPAYLVDHWDARLISWTDGAAILAHRGPRGKCDISVIAPFVMQMIPDTADCALDPARFLTIARAKHKGVDPDLEEATSLPRSARRAFGQAPWDVGRSVYSLNDHAWAFDGDELVYFRGVLSPQKVEHPLGVDRLRVDWGAFAPDGSGIAQVESGVVVVDAMGNLTSSKGVEAKHLSGPDRRDVARATRAAAVKIGETWWQSRGDLAPLYPTAGPAIARLAHDTTAVVGGPKDGLVLELAAPTLRVDRLTEDGTRSILASHATGLGHGFDAVQRASGGAIVVGPSSMDRARLVTYVIAPDGSISDAKAIALSPSGGDPYPFVRLVALPNGGALLFDDERSRVGWLDDDGTLLRSESLGPPSTSTTCVDGRPAPAKLPTAVPGNLIAFPLSAEHQGDASSATTCLSSEVVVAADGSLRWFGTTTDGAHSRAELGLVRGLVSAPAKAAASSLTTSMSPTTPPQRCPSDMVLVGDDLCVDRFEATLVDAHTGRYLSPDYAATPNLMAAALGDWATMRERQGNLFARSLPLPALSQWQRNATLAMRAEPRASVRPAAYVTGLTAKIACDAAGKRLCKHEEWRRACRGDKDTIFPYGTSYEHGICNVNNPAHPGAFLHDNASVGHLDPRLNRVESNGETLLLKTGEKARCASRWGADAIYDMVGNIDEWVDGESAGPTSVGKGGGFAGGFYSRGSTNGCESIITAHPAPYLDYSTGVRCCKDAG